MPCCRRCAANTRERDKRLRDVKAGARRTMLFRYSYSGFSFFASWLHCVADVAPFIAPMADQAGAVGGAVAGVVAGGPAAVAGGPAEAAFPAVEGDREAGARVEVGELNNVL